MYLLWVTAPSSRSLRFRPEMKGLLDSHSVGKDHKAWRGRNPTMRVNLEKRQDTMTTDSTSECLRCAMNAPFEEHPAVRQAKSDALKLISAGCHIYVTGETGTGRRTLAHDLAEVRGERSGSRPSELSQLERISSRACQALLRSGSPSARTVGAAYELVVHDINTLDPEAQIEFFRLMQSGRAKIIATGHTKPASTGFQGTLVPELRTILGTNEILLPPLAVRKGDAIRWARYFCGKVAKEVGRPAPSFTRKAEAAISEYRWPGNLNELETVVARATALASGQELDVPDLRLQPIGDEIIQPLKKAVEEFRRDYIQRALRFCGGNRTHAAKMLDVDARTVFRYLKPVKDDESD